MKVLYVTFDGLLEPLGYSQVVRLVKGLAARGLEYTVVSLEKASDLADAAAVRRLRAELDASGVGWHALAYRSGGTARAAARNVSSLARALVRGRRGVDVIHARSYQAASMASLTQWPGRGPALLFDTRAYWFDERREQGRWFGDDRVFRAALRFERHMIERARGIVTLTELSAEDIRSGRRGQVSGQTPVEAIPTAVDFETFRLDQRAAARAHLASRFEGLGGGPVLGFVGSINSWYAVDEALDLFAAVHRRRADARFVGLSRDHDELARRLAARGVPAAAALCTRAPHHEMPAWVGALDWGFLLLGSSPAKRASMPTKLGEFFASGVRPIHHGCNTEVGDWVDAAGSGLQLPELSPRAIDAAADRIAETLPDLSALERAREVARPHFSLASAIDRYDALLRRIAGRAA